MSEGRAPLRVLLIAEEGAGGRVLRLLHSAPSVSLEAVLAEPSRRGQMGSVWATAERAGCRLIPARRVKEPELADELRGLAIDLVLNVHSLYIVHPALLDLPRLGAYNLHPGPLPEMAGLNVPSWAILLGRAEHGVTLHWMSRGIDDGAIAFEDRFPVAPTATGLALSLECVRRGVKLVERLLETVERREPIPARPQDLSKRAYFDGRPPEGGSIRFGKPAREVAAHLRAADYRPFPSPWGHPAVGCEAGEVTLLSGEVTAPAKTGAGHAWDAVPAGTVRLDGDDALVACGDGWVRLRRVLRDGEARPAASVLRDGEILGSLTDAREVEETTAATEAAEQGDEQADEPAEKQRSSPPRTPSQAANRKVASPPDRAHL